MIQAVHPVVQAGLKGCEAGFNGVAEVSDCLVGFVEFLSVACPSASLPVAQAVNRAHPTVADATANRFFFPSDRLPPALPQSGNRQ